MGFGGTKALQLVSNLILTRLLAPEAFGLMALALIVMATPALAQDSKEQARALAGAPATGAQTLRLVDIPRATGKSIALFDGRSLAAKKGADGARTRTAHAAGRARAPA